LYFFKKFFKKNCHIDIGLDKSSIRLASKRLAVVYDWWKSVW